MSPKKALRKLQEILRDRIKRGDLGFLESLKLGSRQKVVFEDVLTFAASQESFPKLTALNHYIEGERGHSAAHLAHLKRRGLLERLRRGVWRLTEDALLLIAPNGRLFNDKKGYAPTGQTKILLAYLTRERVGSKLLFTAAHAVEAMREMGCRRKEAVWDTLRKLERHGCFTRRREAQGKGILITFPAPTASENETKPETAPRRTKRSGAMTVSSFLRALEEEITSLETQIEKTKKSLGALEELRSKKATLLGEVRNALPR